MSNYDDKVPSVCLSVCLEMPLLPGKWPNFSNGPQVHLHPDCNQGQGQDQRSRDVGTLAVE